MKITFLGAGSLVFAKTVLGDCIVSGLFDTFEISMYDIDPQRLEETYRVVSAINERNGSKARVEKTLNRREALRGADYVVNAIQVGGYKPCTVTDFEVPKKYGLKQTIADTTGIGGIFRALRTLPVLDDFARDIEAVCPHALFLNYTNPMSMLSGYMQRYTDVETIGLCHSVQSCVPDLLKRLQMDEYIDNVRWNIAGINHMAWLLCITDLKGNDLYPEIKKRSYQTDKYDLSKDLVRLKIMQTFGYYNTESSEHSSEYHPYFIKDKYPQLIEKYNIPIDEYITRCENQIKWWENEKSKLGGEDYINHKRSGEFASYIIEAKECGHDMRVHGNVLNTGLIPNLPKEACVEVPLLIDRGGVHPCYVGNLPEVCAALNRTNINVHLLTIRAYRTRKKEDLYAAALLDPHVRSELDIDDTIRMCDDMIEAHGNWIPKFN